MKQLFLVIAIVVLSTNQSSGQKWAPETICSTDTLFILPDSVENKSSDVEQNMQQTYKVITCQTRAKAGFRLDLGYTNYYYGEKTTNWIGQHGSPSIGFILVIDRLNFGLRFKPWTITPKKELEFAGNTLAKNAKLNNIKVDYYVAYSMDLDKLFSIEPYLGYSQTTFLVINEDELEEKFPTKKLGGLVSGITLNKYFKVKRHEYFVAFATLGYNTINFEKMHPDLDKGYTEWSIGLAYKGFGIKRIEKKVESYQ